MKAEQNVLNKHIGRNVKIIRKFHCIKQVALAASLGISQSSVSKMEQQDHIDDVLLERIASVLDLSSDIITNFDEKAFLNNNSRNYSGETILVSQATVQHPINIVETIVKLYERLLQSEREKIKLCLQANNDRFSSCRKRPSGSLKMTVQNIWSEHHSNKQHAGRNIAGIRRLQGVTQTALGFALGITKQAVSKMEQKERIDDGNLERIAEALGVNKKMLKEHNKDKILCETINSNEPFEYATRVLPENDNSTNLFIEKTIVLFETLLEKERQKFEKLKSENK